MSDLKTYITSLPGLTEEELVTEARSAAALLSRARKSGTRRAVTNLEKMREALKAEKTSRKGAAKNPGESTSSSYAGKVARMTDGALRKEHKKMVKMLRDSTAPVRHFGTQGLTLFKQMITTAEKEMRSRGLTPNPNPGLPALPRGRVKRLPFKDTEPFDVILFQYEDGGWFFEIRDPGALGELIYEDHEGRSESETIKVAKKEVRKQFGADPGSNPHIKKQTEIPVDFPITKLPPGKAKGTKVRQYVPRTGAAKHKMLLEELEREGNPKKKTKKKTKNPMPADGEVWETPHGIVWGIGDNWWYRTTKRGPGHEEEGRGLASRDKAIAALERAAQRKKRKRPESTAGKTHPSGRGGVERGWPSGIHGTTPSIKQRDPTWVAEEEITHLPPGPVPKRGFIPEEGPMAASAQRRWERQMLEDNPKKKPKKVTSLVAFLRLPAGTVVTAHGYTGDVVRHHSGMVGLYAAPTRLYEINKGSELGPLSSGARYFFAEDLEEFFRKGSRKKPRKSGLERAAAGAATGAVALGPVGWRRKDNPKKKAKKKPRKKPRKKAKKRAKKKAKKKMSTAGRAAVGAGVGALALGPIGAIGLGYAATRYRPTEAKDNPLRKIPKGASEEKIRGIVSHNIALEMEAGKPQKQALAIAISEARRQSSRAQLMYPERNPIKKGEEYKGHRVIFEVRDNQWSYKVYREKGTKTVHAGKDFPFVLGAAKDAKDWIDGKTKSNPPLEEKQKRVERMERAEKVKAKRREKKRREGRRRPKLNPERVIHTAKTDPYNIRLFMYDDGKYWYQIYDPSHKMVIAEDKKSRGERAAVSHAQCIIDKELLVLNPKDPDAPEAIMAAGRRVKRTVTSDPKIWKKLRKWAFDEKRDIESYEEMTKARAKKHLDSAARAISELRTPKSWEHASRFFDSENFHGLTKPAWDRSQALKKKAKKKTKKKTKKNPKKKARKKRKIHQTFAKWADAQKMAKKHPDTFEVPGLADLKRDVKIGDLVKWNIGAERLWLLVVDVEGDTITGLISNDPLDKKYSFDDVARIKFKHVYDYEKGDKESTERAEAFLDELVEKAKSIKPKRKAKKKTSKKKPKKKAKKKTKKKAKKKLTKKEVKKKLDALIVKSRKLWDGYIAKPTKKRLRTVWDHLGEMGKSTTKEVRDEWRKAKRAAKAEAKRLKMKV